MKTSSKPSASGLQPGQKVRHPSIGDAFLLSISHEDSTAKISFTRGAGSDGTPIIGLAIVPVAELEPAPEPKPQ